MGGIVVGVDGSAKSADALRWAAREARLRETSLAVIMGWGEDEYHEARVDLGVAEATTTKALDQFVADVLGSERERVELRAPRGDVVTQLEEAAQSADLLVVGARGLGGFRGLLLGSVSNACVRGAASPVAVIHNPTTAHDGRSERIVVGVDGSLDGEIALAWAAAEARLRGARLEVVHAWHPPLIGAPPMTVPLDPGPFEDAGRAVLDAAIGRLDSHALDHPIERFLVPDSAAAALLNVSEGADLLVVGSHGRRGMAGVLLGSVSSQVTHHATCPVVVVPKTRA